jgi:hypothetical protein
MTKLFTTCLFAVWLLTGCAISVDPLGMTDREQIRANAAVQIEQQRTLARQAEAQATVDAEIARQSGENHRAATWAMFLPIFLVLVGGTVLLGIVLHWRGRIAHEQLRLQVAARPTVVYIEAAPRSEYQLLRDYARGRGGELIFIAGQPAMRLPNGQQLLIDKGAL